MTKKICVLRKKRDEENSYKQTFTYNFTDMNETVATALIHLNENNPLIDLEGNIADKIVWQCSCLQKKCGACAMRVNGIPCLACSKKLMDCKGETIILEPLKKFPVVEDLMIDRSILFENLKQLRVWLEEEAVVENRDIEDVYTASRCLQCGCCLEVCPNFALGENFMGMAAGVPLSSLIIELPKEQRRDIYNSYRKHIYEGCGKSLACKKICPAGIDAEHLMVRSNAAAVWGRHVKKVASAKH